MDNATGGAATAARPDKSISTLPVAPKYAHRLETGEQRDRNGLRYQRALDRRDSEVWIEVFCADDDEKQHRHRHLLHIVEAEARYGAPTWTQAHIADDGRTRVRRRDGDWQAWKQPSSRSRATCGRAPREATNTRRNGSRRGVRAASSSSDDPGSDPEPAERRLCQNRRCQADISHLHVLAEYCDNGGACKQAAYRDRQVLEYLDGLAGTTTSEVSCRCEPRGQLVVNGVCFPCGRPRGAITREWLDDAGLPARSFVSTRAPARRNPRYGDRKRKPVREYIDREAVAA